MDAVVLLPGQGERIEAGALTAVMKATAATTRRRAVPYPGCGGVRGARPCSRAQTASCAREARPSLA